MAYYKYGLICYIRLRKFPNLAAMTIIMRLYDYEMISVANYFSSIQLMFFINHIQQQPNKYESPKLYGIY